MSVNNMYFSKEMVANGDLNSFIDFLLKLSYSDKTEYYNDIHLYPADCGAFILEWVQVPWDKSFGGRFEYLDEEQEIVKAYDLPDKTFEYFHNDEEYKDFLNDWLKNNPGWKKHNVMNTWVKEESYENH